MPIQLTLPHRYDPGHGGVAVDFPHLMITEMTIHPAQKSMVLTLQYGERDAEGVWTNSPEPPHHLRIQNVPAVVVGGQHPQTGEWIEEVTVPEDLAYDRLKELFVISDTMVGWQTYDVLSFQLYGWLISEGHYGGTIV